MLYRVIDASELPSLVSAFLETYEVIAPVKSGMSHAYSTVESFEEIVLDYTTTITPLKKPPCSGSRYCKELSVQPA